MVSIGTKNAWKIVLFIYFSKKSQFFSNDYDVIF